jgi:four helix bundle protein
MDEEELKQRTKKFGLRVIKVVEALPRNKTSNVIGNQVLRSATSIGANYRAACRGKSKADFAAKISIALEEADETLYWLEMIVEAGLISKNLLESLMIEANELVSILAASNKTARQNSVKEKTDARQFQS